MLCLCLSSPNGDTIPIACFAADSAHSFPGEMSSICSSSPVVLTALRLWTTRVLSIFHCLCPTHPGQQSPPSPTASSHMRNLDLLLPSVGPSFSHRSWGMYVAMIGPSVVLLGCAPAMSSVPTSFPIPSRTSCRTFSRLSLLISELHPWKLSLFRHLFTLTYLFALTHWPCPLRTSGDSVFEAALSSGVPSCDQPDLFVIDSFAL